MEDNVRYMKNVMTEVRDTLRRSMRSDDAHLRARAWFCENKIHYNQFDLVIYRDPLLTRASDDVRGSYFTV